MRHKFLFTLLLIVSYHFTSAQNILSSDELFQQARKTAFDLKNYPKAIFLCKEALNKSPDYSDIRIFLGRLYTWSKKPDSARMQLASVLKSHPDYEDASLALGSLEFWNDNLPKALQVLNDGLSYHPASKDLLLLKAKVLNDQKKYREANMVIDTLLKIDKGNAGARSLSARIAEKALKNKFGINYDFIYFDKQYNTPWQLASIDYSRQTPIGSVIARFNYANRFNTNGTQFEMDAYPHISKIFYAYLNGGYSSDVGIFPKYRAGFSLYANLPASFEAEAGFRLLRFSGSTWIYTASVGKYYKSFWFNLRTYITPSNNNISQSYSISSRYYYGGADDYLSMRVGTGISPDDPQNSVLLNNATVYKLRSNSIAAGFRHAFKARDIVLIDISLANQEYLPQTRGNQFDVGIGYIRRF